MNKKSSKVLWVRCLLAAMSLFSTSVITANSATLEIEKSFASEDEYIAATTPRRPRKSHDKVQFFNAARSSIRELPLYKTQPLAERQYTQDAVVTDSRVLLTKATHQFEVSFNQSIQLFDLDGNFIAEILDAPHFWASPRGDVIVITDDAGSPPLTNRLRIYDGDGKLIAKHELSRLPSVGDGKVVFSKTGQTLIYVLNGGRNSPAGPYTAGVAVLRTTGELLGQFSQEYIAFGGSGDFKHFTVDPISLILEKKGRILIQAHKEGLLDPVLYCLNLKGAPLWERVVPLTTRRMHISADPDGEQLYVVGLDDRLTVATRALSSGDAQENAGAPISLAADAQVMFSRLGNVLAISGPGLKINGILKNAVLIDEHAKVLWADDGNDPSAGVRFDTDGRVIWTKHHKIHVGKMR